MTDSGDVTHGSLNERLGKPDTCAKQHCNDHASTFLEAADGLCAGFCERHTQKMLDKGGWTRE